MASAFTDLFGTQSGTYNARIRDGENLCKASLRAQTLELSGNAIIAVDVDYAEVGGQRAMLMVCMTATAISISHMDRPDTDFLEATAAGARKAARIRGIQTCLAASPY